MVEAQFSDLAGKPLQPGRWEQLGLVACGTGLAPLLQVVLSLVLHCCKSGRVVVQPIEAREVLAWNDGTRVSPAHVRCCQGSAILFSDREAFPLKNRSVQCGCLQMMLAVQFQWWQNTRDIR